MIDVCINVFFLNQSHAPVKHFAACKKVLCKSNLDLIEWLVISTNFLYYENNANLAGTLTKKEERKMVARVTSVASTSSGGISVPLRPMMGVKISNTTQMRNMKWT